MIKRNRQYLELWLAAGVALVLLALPSLAADPSVAIPAAADRVMEETTVSEHADPRKGAPPRGWTSSDDRRAVRVNFGDLNLNNEAGLESLYRRLDSAAVTVCSPREESRTLARHRNWQLCHDSAMDSAVDKIGIVDLRNLHLVRTGRQDEVSTQIANR